MVAEPPERSINVDAIRRDWAARGFTCDIWIDPPGQTWENFVHEVDELVMVLEGELEFELEGKRIRLRPGEELLIPAHTLHSARNVGTGTARWLYGYRQS